MSTAVGFLLVSACSREVTIFLCWAVFNTLGLVTNLPQLAHLEAGRLADVLEEQNAIKLVPAAYVRRKGCEVGLDPLVARGRRRRSGCYMSDVAFSRAGSKGPRGVSGDEGFVWKSRPRGRFSQGDKAWPKRCTSSSSGCFLKILTVDRDHPPDCTHLSKLRPATGQLGQPLLPPCRASCSFLPEGS